MPEDKDFELDELDSFSFEDLDLEGDPAVASSTMEPDTEYGVWVKTTIDGKRDEPLSGEVSPQDHEIEIFSTSQDSDSHRLVQTLEEEPLLGTLAEDPNDDRYAEISLDDFVDFEDDSAQEVQSTAEIPEAPALESESEEDFLDIDIEIEDEINDQELEILEGAQFRNETTSPVESIAGAQEIDLSEFGDFFDEEPELDSAKRSEGLDSVEEISEAEIPEEIAELSDNLSPAEEIELQGDQFSVKSPTMSNGDPQPDLEAFDTDAFFEIPTGSAPTEVTDDGRFEEILLADAKDEMNMDHIIALENDLTSGIRSAPDLELPVSPPTPIQSPSPVAEGDLASRVLLKIESELSSIKQELSDLKKEITSIRTPNPVEQVSEEPQQARHGFFDEEDDETIALTGDELENIFSTAQINETEESGEKLEGLDDLIQLTSEGVPTEIEPEPLPTNDQEFFSGTPLADGDEIFALPPENDDIPLPGQAHFSNIPESIELEDALNLDDIPPALEDEATENLMGSPIDSEEIDLEGIEPIASDTFEVESPILEIPFDDDILLEEETPIDEAFSVGAEREPESVSELEELATTNGIPLGNSAQDTVETSVEESLDMPPAPLTAESGLTETGTGAVSQSIKEELKAVLGYLDRLLASLPDEKIQEFAESEHFGVYKRLFEELGLIE